MKLSNLKYHTLPSIPRIWFDKSFHFCYFFLCFSLFFIPFDFLKIVLLSSSWLILFVFPISLQTAIEDNIATYISNSNLVNFNKMRLLAKLLREIRETQFSVYSFQVCLHFLLWCFEWGFFLDLNFFLQVNQQIHNYFKTLPQFTEDDLYKRSLVIEPRKWWILFLSYVFWFCYTFQISWTKLIFFKIETFSHHNIFMLRTSIDIKNEKHQFTYWWHSNVKWRWKINQRGNRVWWQGGRCMWATSPPPFARRSCDKNSTDMAPWSGATSLLRGEGPKDSVSWSSKTKGMWLSFFVGSCAFVSVDLFFLPFFRLSRDWRNVRDAQDAFDDMRGRRFAGRELTYVLNYDCHFGLWFTLS